MGLFNDLKHIPFKDLKLSFLVINSLTQHDSQLCVISLGCIEKPLQYANGEPMASTLCTQKRPSTYSIKAYIYLLSLLSIF